MGACRDRVLIIADKIAGAGGECRPFSNHQVAPVLQAVEPGTRPPAGCVVYALAMSSLTELRLRETGRERKCMHPLRNEFGSNALIVAVLLRSSEAGSHSAAAAQRFSASRVLSTHPRAPRREHPRARRRGRGLP
jgi:hypothetical protein